MRRLPSSGVLRYSIDGSYHRLVVEMDPEIHRLYRALIPKYYVCRPQKYAPHITVVRGEQPLTGAWGKHEGKGIDFEYETYLHYNGIYWWINCHSVALTSIRLELGLPSSYYLTRPPDDAECFHSTIGNSKKL